MKSTLSVERIMGFITSEMILTDRFMDTLNRVEDIPTFPEVVQKLKDVLADPYFRMDSVARVITEDPAVAARLIKLVNSAYYSPSGDSKPITSVPFAVNRVGLEEIRHIVATLSVFSSFAGDWKNVERVEFWNHCLETAVTTETVLKFTKRKSGDLDLVDDLYMAGLLHDMGVVVLDQYFRSEFTGILEVSRVSLEPLQAVEHAMIGMDHAIVGAWVARKWKMPGVVESVVRYHHRPLESPTDYRLCCAICSLADYLCREGENSLTSRTPEPPPLEVMKYLGISEAELPEITEAAEDAKQSAHAIAAVAI